MTIYESVMKMNKEQFSKFCFSLYNQGWLDKANDEDDESWVLHRMADCEVEDCDFLDGWLG